ncbi:hypothetical protein J6590_029426 [Homalodisca vitripennis]|nr:hypothetical protein J6590_029426 [Homalodisca vitripennis]
MSVVWCGGDSAALYDGNGGRDVRQGADRAWIFDLTHPLYSRCHPVLAIQMWTRTYETRGRNNFRTEQHRTTMFEHLPSEVGVKVFNKLPGDLKRINELKQFKSRLRHFLLSQAFLPPLMSLR